MTRQLTFAQKLRLWLTAANSVIPIDKQVFPYFNSHHLDLDLNYQITVVLCIQGLPGDMGPVFVTISDDEFDKDPYIVFTAILADINYHKADHYEI